MGKQSVIFIRVADKCCPYIAHLDACDRRWCTTTNFVSVESTGAAVLVILGDNELNWFGVRLITCSR